MIYSVPRYSQKEFSWLSDAWQAVKNNVRYWWHTPGERDAIAHGEDPEKVKGFWANYRPRWNTFKDTLLSKFAPLYEFSRRNYLMKDHDERYQGKLPLGQNPVEAEYSISGSIMSRERYFALPQYPQPQMPKPQGQGGNKQGASQNQNVNPQQQQPTARDLQNQQFQMQKQLMQNQRQRQRLLEQERRDRLRTQQMEMRMNQEKEKQVQQETNQSIKTTQQNQKDDMGGGDHIPLYKEHTLALKPKTMR